MKRARDLFSALISEENLRRAILEVNKTHRWKVHHRPNKVVAWVETDIERRVKELRTIIVNGFEPAPPTIKRRWDKCAGKWRDICEPKLWPDQYIHHAVVQILEPVFMRGMDHWCCGSIKGRGTHYGAKAISKWMKEDPKGTKYSLEADVRHFYNSLQPEAVFTYTKRLVKDHLFLDVIWRVIKDGILIGGYFSQWFANAFLQPLDHLIREGGFRVSHYIRYIDNFTVFSPNKRALHRLVHAIKSWLSQFGMELKGNWQIFRTSFTKKVKERHRLLNERKQRLRRPRLPNALGYRYGNGYTLLRKRNLIRLKRQLARLTKKLREKARIPVSLAQGVLSRIGQLIHCNSRFFFRRFIKPGMVGLLKSIVREHTRKERAKWSTNLFSAPSSETASC